MSDAPSEAQATLALGVLKAHEHGHTLAEFVFQHLEAALVHTRPFNQGLMRVSPEWYWRDFRLRLSATIAHSNNWRGRLWCGRSIVNSLQPNKGLKKKVSSPWPQFAQDGWV